MHLLLMYERLALLMMPFKITDRTGYPKIINCP